MSFRIGRKHARHFYPERRAGAGPATFARNFAMGPSELTPINTAGGGGTQIPWDFIESGAPIGVNVPITPRVTGRVVFSGVVIIKNNNDTRVDVTLQVQVDGSTLSAPLVRKTIAAASIGALPFEEIQEALFPLGVTAQISLILTSSVGGGVVNATVDSSTIEIEEVQLAGP